MKLAVEQLIQYIIVTWAVSFKNIYILLFFCKLQKFHKLLTWGVKKKSGFRVYPAFIQVQDIL